MHAQCACMCSDRLCSSPCVRLQHQDQHMPVADIASDGVMNRHSDDATKHKLSIRRGCAANGRWTTDNWWTSGWCIGRACKLHNSRFARQLHAPRAGSTADAMAPRAHMRSTSLLHAPARTDTTPSHLDHHIRRKQPTLVWSCPLAALLAAEQAPSCPSGAASTAACAPMLHVVCDELHHLRRRTR